MNTQTEKPLSTHTAERTLYKVEVRRRKNTPSDILLNEKFIGTEWERFPLPHGRRFRLSEHLDTAAELEDGLFPYPLAMAQAWDVLAIEHAHFFEVRLVPHLVKTSYASFPMEPMPELNRRPE